VTEAKDIFWGNLHWIKNQDLSEESVIIKIESALVVLNGGLESKLSASQLKHGTGAYYGSKAEWMDNWIITALTGPWEKWLRTLICSSLQLYLLCGAKTGSFEGAGWVCGGSRCSAASPSGCCLGPKRPKCDFGRGKLYITGMDWHGRTRQVSGDLSSLLTENIKTGLRLHFRV